jgi:hypothetical protein
MGTITRQKIQDYYNEFKNIPVTFNKEIIQVTGLQTKQIILKCASDFFPCFVYSSSFEEAKIVASTKTGILDKLKESNNAVSIRFCFRPPSSSDLVAFQINTRVTGSVPYDTSTDMYIFTLNFSQRPPDDLIGVVGRILDANVNFSKRRDERINITPENLRRLYFATKDIEVLIEGVPRRCILRDISFGGARFIMLGVSKFLIDKSASIKFDFDDPEETYTINGKLIGAEKVADRNDMIVMNMAYNDPIPMTYKVRLNDFLNSYRLISDSENRSPVASAPPPRQAAPAAKITPAPAAATPPPA